MYSNITHTYPGNIDMYGTLKIRVGRIGKMLMKNTLYTAYSIEHRVL